MAATLLVLVAGAAGGEATGFWRDEGTTVGIARRGLGGVIEVIFNREANMALYYVLLHWWLQLGGESVGWVRALSLFFAALTVPALVWVALQLRGPRAAGVTAFLVLGSSVLLRNSAEARAYSLVVLLSVLTIGLLLRALGAGSRLALWGAVVAATAMVYTQVLSILLIASLLLPVMLYPKSKIPGKVLLFATAVWSLLVSPLIWFSIARDRGQSSWISPLGTRTIREIAATFAGTLPAAIALTIVVLAALFLLVRAPLSDYALLFTFSWLIVPPTMLLAVSLVRPLFVPRYVAFSAPALVLLSALVILSLRGRWKVLVLLVFLAATVVGSLSTIFGRRADDVSAAAAFISSRATPADAVAYDPATTRACIGFLLEGHVRDIALAPGGSPSDQGDTWGVEMSTPEVQQALARERRVWLISYPGATWLQTPEPVRAVRARVLPETPTVSAEFGEMLVQLYER